MQNCLRLIVGCVGNEDESGVVVDRRAGQEVVTTLSCRVFEVESAIFGELLNVHAFDHAANLWGESVDSVTNPFRIIG